MQLAVTWFVLLQLAHLPIVCPCRFRRSITDHSWSLVLTLLLLMLFGLSRPGVFDTAVRRFCCCRLRTGDRGGNPRFDINRSTPLSERCSPFAKAAFQRHRCGTWGFVVVEEGGVVFLAGRSEVVIHRISSLCVGSSCRWDDAADLHRSCD